MLPIDKRTALVAGGINYQTGDFYQENTYITINGTAFRSFKPAGMALADADIGFTKHVNGFDVIANGTVTVNNTAGVTGKLEVATDPDDVGKKCWLMSINKSDTDSQGTNAKRAEFGFTNSRSLLPVKTEAVVGFKFRIGDYRTSLDDFLIMQLWSSPDANGWSPPFSVIYRQGIFTLEKRYGLAYNAQVFENLYQNANLAPNVWHTLVVKMYFSELINGDISTDGNLIAYLDGVKVVDFTGKLGYGTQLTLKSGLYQWNAPTNWDNNYLTKTMYAKGPYMALTGKCNLSEMQSFLTPL
jgi:hypothetical protein